MWSVECKNQLLKDDGRRRTTTDHNNKKNQTKTLDGAGD